MNQVFDWIIFGAGIYGLFFAKKLAETGKSVCVVECDPSQFQRASYINQARVHNGYHYPRSISTAIKSHKYYDRFNKEFDFAINNKFLKIYAISSTCSLTNSAQFVNFCNNTGIKSEEIHPDKYFIKNSVEGAFLTEEFAFDGEIVGKWFIEKLSEMANVTVLFSTRVIAGEINNASR